MSQKFAEKMQSDEGRRNVFHTAKLMAKVGHDVMNANCLRNQNGKIVVDSEGIKAIWTEYTQKAGKRKYMGSKCGF